MLNLFFLARLSRSLRIYFLVSGSLILISSFILYYFSPAFIYKSIESTRFVLSTLVESEATVIAIVITLTLVVLQLTASSYSTRVIDIFEDSPSIWLIVGIYIIAIGYGLTVLNAIDAIHASGILNFEISVWVAYFLGIFAFGALIPYLLGSLEIMKSSTVVDRFAERITNENILAGVQESEKIVGADSNDISYSYIYSDIMRPVIDTESDPVQPVIDIIHSSMMKYDYGTMRYGLNVLENYMMATLKNGKFEREEGIVVKHIFTHLERVGKLAASRDDEDSVMEVVITIYLIGKTAMENKIESVVGEAVNSIKNIARLAINREMVDIRAAATDLIGEIGRWTAQNELDFATSVAVNSLGIIAIDAAKHAQRGLEETVWMGGTIYGIGKLAITQKLEQSVSSAVNSMGNMGRYTARNDLPKTTIRIVNYLSNLGTAALESEFSKNTNDVAEYLWEIGRIAVWSELSVLAAHSILKHAKESLENIRKRAKELEVKETSLAAQSSLEKINKIIKEKSIHDGEKVRYKKKLD
ncbi:MULTISPECIES: DUF2254 family protein [Methanobacterium]|uniref:DUF2254 family protein n=1 Tax=Methanobacterium TaxID=2160 RepID=UPI0021016F04|nr:MULTISPECIES: DUF2254 family protein [Methanobacterium]